MTAAPLHRLARAALLALLSTAVPASAATVPGTPTNQAPPPAAIPEDIAPEQVDAVMAGLTDAQARQALADELRRRAKTEQTDSAHGGFGVALVMFRKGVEAVAEGARRHVAQVLAGYAELPSILPGAVERMTGAQGLGVLLVDLAIVLVLGFVARWLVRRALAGRRARLEHAPGDGVGRRVAFALLRALVELVPLAVFAVVSLGLATALYGDSDAAQGFVVAYVTGVLVILASDIPARLLLAPAAPGLRLLPVEDDRARFLYLWTVVLVSVGTIAWLTAGLVVLTGMSMQAHLAVVSATGGLMAALAVIAVLDWGRRFGMPGTGIWTTLAASYVVLVYLLWLQKIVMRSASTVWPAIGSLLLVAAIPLANRAIARVVQALQLPEPAPAAGTTPGAEAIAEVPAEEREAVVERLAQAEHEEAAARARRAHYLQVMSTTLRGAVLVAAVLVLFELWGLDLLGLAVARGAILRAGAVVAVAVVLWLVFKALITPYLPEPGAAAGDEDGTVPRTRTETLLPLAYTTVAVILVVFTTMIALSALGVDIGPLLAGAGVVGLAIGFGAQTLVRDIVAGIFFLIDDAFRVGEYIEFDKLRGEVEGMSLRSLRLRHHRGAVHTVPFGELQSVTNYSRDWVIYKLEFRLAADTDVERVRKLIKKLGVELMDNPDYGQDFLQPLKSQGIARVEENAIILRCKFMSKPRKQFVLRRHCYQRIKQLFEEEGIEFAPRTVRVASGAAAGPVEVPGGGAAALAAVEQQGGS